MILENECSEYCVCLQLQPYVCNKGYRLWQYHPTDHKGLSRDSEKWGCNNTAHIAADGGKLGEIICVCVCLYVCLCVCVCQAIYLLKFPLLLSSHKCAVTFILALLQFDGALGPMQTQLFLNVVPDLAPRRELKVLQEANKRSFMEYFL